jgi:excisionase family DNA binding protein
MELLTSKQLCERLSVSYMTLYRMMQKGLPCIVLGSRVYRYDYDAVMDWLRTSNIAERKEGKV